MERQIKVYENEWAIDLVREQLSKVSLEVTRLDKLEHRVINTVGKYLLSPNGSIRHKRFIRRIVLQEIETAKRLYHAQVAELFASVSHEDEEGQEIDYEPEDVLANVASSELELRETVTLLAKDDQRRNTILTEWMNGNTNDVNIAGILADTLGGKAVSHRKYIQRFRIECQKQLSLVA